MTNRAIAHARLRNGRLVGPRLPSPEAVVGWFGAVQAQDLPGSLWGIAQRIDPSVGRRGSADTTATPGLAELSAVLDEGRLARVHALRPTWHLLVPSELRWIQALTSGRVHRATGTISRRLGVGPSELARGAGAIRAALAGGAALTRGELAAAVASTGIDLRHPMVITYIAMHAELEGLIVNGPRRGNQITYLLADERIPPQPPLGPAEALRTLTIRYFRSHGPALAHDMAWWSGLTVSAVREGIGLAGAALEGRRVDGSDVWAAAGAFDPSPDLVPEGHVLLLPNYDENVGSYADRRPLFDETLPKARTSADVLGAHLVMREGLVVGGWRRAIGRDRVTITVDLLRSFGRSELEALAVEAARYGRFLGMPADLVVREG